MERTKGVRARCKTCMYRMHTKSEAQRSWCPCLRREVSQRSVVCAHYKARRVTIKVSARRYYGKAADVESVQGKYSFNGGSSEEFLKMKAEDNANAAVRHAMARTARHVRFGLALADQVMKDDTPVFGNYINDDMNGNQWNMAQAAFIRDLKRCNRNIRRYARWRFHFNRWIERVGRNG